MAENHPTQGPVTILAQFIARPGRESAVRSALLDRVEPTRAASGNGGFDVHHVRNDPATFYTLESWTDLAAREAHESAPRIRAVMETIAPELVAPPAESRARMISSPDPRPDRPRPVADSPDQLTLIPFFKIKADEIDAVRRAHLGVIESTRAEAGCIDYDLYQSLDDPSVLFFYENWTDADALAAHASTPNFYRVVRGEIDRRLVVPWTALTLTMVSEPV